MQNYLGQGSKTGLLIIMSRCAEHWCGARSADHHELVRVLAGVDLLLHIAAHGAAVD